MPRYRRNIFTGELEEVEFEGSHVIYRGELKTEPKGYNVAWSKEFRSRALGVHPSEVPEANRRIKELGISGYFDRKGDFRTNSRQARNKLLYHKGCFDKDGSYGDYTGR